MQQNHLPRNILISKNENVTFLLNFVVDLFYLFDVALDQNNSSSTVICINISGVQITVDSLFSHLHISLSNIKSSICEECNSPAAWQILLLIKLCFQNPQDLVLKGISVGLHFEILTPYIWEFSSTSTEEISIRLK